MFFRDVLWLMMVCCWNRYGLQEQHEICMRSCYGYLTLRGLDQSRLAFQMMALTPLHVLSVQIRVGMSDVGHEVPPQVSKDVAPQFNIATPLICHNLPTKNRENSVLKLGKFMVSP